MQAVDNTASLESENAALRSQIGELERELAVLRAHIDWFKKQLFGKKSERLDPKQLQLQLAELGQLTQKLDTLQRRQVAAHERAAATEKRTISAEAIAKLPVRETIVIEPEEVKAAPQNYERIGEEKTHEVDITPPAFWKREIIRLKYRRKDDASLPPLLAPAPKRPVEGGHASAGLLAHIAVSKYADHLPLHRLEQMTRRWGLPITRQSMNEWIRLTAEWLKPVHELIRKNLLAGDYIQVDETPVDYLDPGAGKGQTRRGYLWGMTRPGADVLFEWRLTRNHDELPKLIGKNYRKLLQSDAYGAYPAYLAAQKAAGGKKLTWLCCWAHARRKFHDALKTHPRESRLALRLIARLYQWETRWDGASIHDPPLRAALRRRHFARPLKWLFRFARHWRKSALPKSPLGEAITYLLNQQRPLLAHLKHGQTRLDTNIMENAIRPCALGRKNWLFIGHPDAGQRSAILYSIMASCRRHGKDPHAYLRDVLTQLPSMTNQDDLTLLLPSRWQPPTAGVPAKA